jgi:tetratricopeptide (TPR) repeat protein
VACGLGTIAYWQGQRQEALRQFRQALTADPGSELALYNVALLESAGGVSSSAFALARRLMSRGRPHGYLLSPSPPLDGVEAELVRLRRAERGLPGG